jgi:Phage tail lysozyme
VRAAAHGRKRKVRRRGRHSAPSAAHKVARKAGKAAPAVVAVGALAAVPQVRDFVASATTALTGGQRPAAHQPGSDQAVSDAGGNAESFNVHPYRPRHAAGGASAPPAGSTTSSHVATREPTHRHAHHPSSPAPQPSSPAPQPSSTSPRSAGSPRPTTRSRSVPKCTGTAGMLPENYAAIVDFLVAHGYTGFAAAGIAGNIYQESKGDPESVGSGGGGLIGWTPLPSGFVTGNPAADLQTQLNALLTYNQQWSQFLPALNAATSATQAADIYMNDFERPGFPAAANREQAAQDVATACGI